MHIGQFYLMFLLLGLNPAVVVMFIFVFQLPVSMEEVVDLLNDVNQQLGETGEDMDEENEKEMERQRALAHSSPAHPTETSAAVSHMKFSTPSPNKSIVSPTKRLVSPYYGIIFRLLSQLINLSFITFFLYFRSHQRHHLIGLKTRKVSFRCSVSRLKLSRSELDIKHISYMTYCLNFTSFSAAFEAHSPHYL